MLSLRYERFWQIASVILILIVLVAALSPVNWFFAQKDGGLDWVPHLDKWAHAFTFAVLAIWFAGLYRSGWWIAVWLLFLGGAIELCQQLVAYRSADWGDMGANMAGIIAGLGIAATSLGDWRRLAEKWYATRNA